MKLKERFGLWLCRRGWHSWEEVYGETKAGRWYEYVIYKTCRRCGVKRTEAGDMTDKMR